MSPDMFRKLAALGLDHDQMAGVLELFEEAEEARKSKGRDRWHKWNDKRKQTSANVSKHVQTLETDSRAGDTRGENNLQNKISTGSKKQDTRRNGLADFKAVLLDHLGDERLEAFIASRRAKRAAFTGHAANLFLADAKAVSMSPADAADLAISRGWITVKPEYLRDHRPAQRAASPPQQRDSFREALEREAYGHERTDSTTRHGHQGDAGTDFPGPPALNLVALPARR